MGILKCCMCLRCRVIIIIIHNMHSGILCRVTGAFKISLYFNLHINLKVFQLLLHELLFLTYIMHADFI